LQKNGRTTFDVSFKGQKIASFNTEMTGSYNILNATAVVAQAHIQKWDIEQVKAALESFQGVKRRQEILGEYGGVLLIEDFAHHPTAVKETVKAIQDKYEDYVDAFSIAHDILLAEAFDQGKISEDDRFSSQELIDDLVKLKKSAKVFNGADSIVEDLGQRAKKGDVILIMSNGGFDGIYTKLINRLKS
jgi:UDP-N-acetylmuramate: L-alanyl-gamma-D-glutamyl-meso-diaminopimelate ligase